MKFVDIKNIPQKVRLSGSDCFHLVLDKLAKQHQAGSNVMRIVFYFNKTLSAEVTREVLDRSPLAYWLCNIKFMPGSLFKIPCWKFKDAGNHVIITEHSHDILREIPFTVLQKDIPITAERFIDCDIIHYTGHGSALVLSWNHIVMDGRGISMFIRQLNEISHNEKMDVGTFFPQPEKKISIIRYIHNMYKVKKFIQSSSKNPIASVAEKNAKSVLGFNNKIISFTQEQTEKINNNAFANGARFGANLFYLSCCAHAVNTVLKQRNKQGTLWVPIPYDGRLKGSMGPVISNFVAYLFYRVPLIELNSIQQTVKCLAAQMTAQLKTNMPRQYSMLLNMMRHIPLRLYYFLINHTGKGSFASFLYSSTGENFNTITSLFNEPVEHLTIYPSPTFPPGLTFSFLKHRDALNINIAYSPNIINNTELAMIEHELQGLFLSDFDEKNNS